ncbi:hypothetical protein [Bradyrhizobium elkanii]|uniref:hypothetical protein n=1 Tax=Bradyrhizobium elkanii TaxID=29448 RepID=UPI003516AEA7
MKDAIARNYDAVEDGGELFHDCSPPQRLFLPGGTVGRTAKPIRALRWQSYFAPGLVIRTFDPHIHICPGQPTRGLCMFTSEQHRPRATARGELVKGSQR